MSALLLLCLLAQPEVRPVPKALGLDAFYSKYVDAGGIPVVGSGTVDDRALREAARLVGRMLKDRPDVRKALVQAKVRVAVMAESEKTTDIPEHSDLTPKAYWDRRARGLGATAARPASSCAEENLLGYKGDRYKGECIFIHEFAHTMHLMGLNRVDGGFDARLKALYGKALANGLWKKTYAATNAGEYWAEGVQSYFDANRESAPADGVHNHVDTREELEAHDPELAALVAEVFRNAQWRWMEPVFDGRSLDGWVTRGGRYDGKARWTVEAGAITGREGPNHAGGLLYTARVYRNFEVELETFITYPFDSGIFLRMRPDRKGAQVTLDYRPGGEIGGIYSEGWWYHNPAGKEAYRRDAWNRFKVRCAGEPMHLMVWMNGALVTDYRFPERSGAFAPDGRIGLQVHGSRNDPPGSRAMFRDIRVRELPLGAGRYFEGAGKEDDGRLRLTGRGRAAGWRRLAWRPASGFRMGEEGSLALLVKGKAPHIESQRDYRDFHLRLDFKIARMANSGLFLRADRKRGDPAHSGCEIQILDDFNWEKMTNTKLRPWQFSGSLYGAVPPRRKALEPLGEWNTCEVIYKGPRIVTVLNGKILYDTDTFQLKVNPPFSTRATSGFIGLQRHAPSQVEGEAYAWFRNAFVRELE